MMGKGCGLVVPIPVLFRADTSHLSAGKDKLEAVEALQVRIA